MTTDRVSPNLRLLVYSDGASRGNPGLAGAGWAIFSQQGARIALGGMFLGRRTNNEAEYLAAAMGLQAAWEIGASDVTLRADSELMVRQLEGRYRVKNERLLPLYEAVVKCSQKFRTFAAEHVRREYNKEADKQANLAIDNRAQ